MESRVRRDSEGRGRKIARGSGTRARVRRDSRSSGRRGRTARRVEFPVARGCLDKTFRRGGTFARRELSVDRRVGRMLRTRQNRRLHDACAFGGTRMEIHRGFEGLALRDSRKRGRCKGSCSRRWS